MSGWSLEDAGRLNKQAQAEYERFCAILLLTGFEVAKVHHLVNGYEGWNNGYVACPWYLFETQVGLIKLGWRRRVVMIDWESTGVEWDRPGDDGVTKGLTFTHAWGYEKAQEYLRLLFPALKAAAK